MGTLGTMRTRIADELQIDATVFATEIDRAIYTAIEFYNDHDFWFMESIPTKFVGTLTNEFSLAAVLPGVSNIKDVVVHLGSRRLSMEYRTHAELIDLDIDDNFAGDPVYWTIHHQALIVEPRLRASHTIEVFHTSRLTLTASASASAVWTTEAEELIRMHAEADICNNRTKDYQQADRCKIQEVGALAALDEKTVRRNAYRRIRPHL